MCIYANTVTFGAALLAAKVLESHHPDVRLADGTLHKVDGFHTREQELWRRLLYSGRISYLRQDYRDIRGGNALMVAGSLRYVLP
uniref:hypothetical protein n=1 Tax=Acinetobacter baumannii TaxID=470 RepID=UPI0013D80A6E